MPIFPLDPARAATLSHLLDEVLDLPEADRQAWLDQLTDLYADLKPHLRDLLSRAAQLETADFLGSAPRIALPEDSLRTPDPALASGVVVGPYRLERELGHGGMGSVWLAERIDGQLRRQVALKLPHGSQPIAQLTERMRREQDILAALEHPNIARLYDAGIAANGQPYLALEYVEGVPIDSYCQGSPDRPRLSVADRVRLFLQVVGATAHAHGKLVLHRDLKPDNILVTPAGAVRLLDFGIAKILTEGVTQDTRLTQVAGRALSPEYASPEQVRGESLSVTSDIYSLGVVLFELLTGELPYELKRKSRALLEEAILSGEPRRPSDVADADDRRALRGDLETVVLRALKKSPAERYPTAYAFMDDLERALDGRPVRARPDSLRYRAGKFVSRHRFAVAGTVLLVLTLIGGIVGTTIGMIRARRAESAARTESATATRYANFLVYMFEVAVPGQSKGPDVTAREILQKGAVRVRRDLADEPLLQGRLLATIGWVNTRLGLYPDARAALDEAVSLTRRLGDDGRSDLAQALVRRGAVERYLNEPDKAESDDREALAVLEQLYGPDDVHIMPALSELALLMRISNPDEALRLNQRGYDLIMASHEEGKGDAAVLLGNIAGLHLHAHRYAAAKEAYERALPGLIDHFGEHDPHVGAVLSNLGDLYRSLGDYPGAVEMGRHALDVDTAVSGAEHTDVGIDWLKLARSTAKIGDLKSALEQLDRATAIFRQRLPPAHSLLIQAATFKADVLIGLGRLGDARAALGEYSDAQVSGVEARRSGLYGRLTLAEIERLEQHAPKAQVLVESVLADPVVASDRFLESDARWAYAYALATQGKTRAATTERARALGIESQPGNGAPFPAVLADAKYHVCAGDVAGASSLLRAAIAKGFHDTAILQDPAFAPLRVRPEYAAMANAVTAHSVKGTAAQ